MSDDFTSVSRDDLAARLKKARVACGWTTRDVADKLKDECPISHATIANYERGRTSPSLAVLSSMAALYGKPSVWFLGKSPRLTGVRYRCRKSQIRKGDKAWYETNATMILEAYAKLENELRDPLRRQVNWEFRSNESPEQLASRIREVVDLKEKDPVPSVVEVLELFGIRTIELSTDLPIDGIAAMFGDEPAVVLNPNTSNDRCRMNASHELMHIVGDDCRAGDGKEENAMESFSKAAASHFLIPQSQLVEAFNGQSMVRLVQYKERFGISLQAMIYRAQEAGIITKDTSTWLWIEFTKRGWKKKEPGNVRPDRATRFERLLDDAVGTQMKWSDIAKLTNVREEVLRNRRRFALGLNDNETEQTTERSDELNENLLKFPR